MQLIERTKEFPANVTGLCNYCAYQTVCPMWTHEIELAEKNINEFLKDSGVKLVNNYVKTDAEIKEILKEKEEKLEKIKQALIEYAKKKDDAILLNTRTLKTKRFKK